MTPRDWRKLIDAVFGMHWHWLLSAPLLTALLIEILDVDATLPAPVIVQDAADALCKEAQASAAKLIAALNDKPSA